MAVLMLGTMGSNLFRCYKGTLKECKDWQKEITEKETIKENIYPQKIISDKKAKYLKWSDYGIYDNPKRFTYVFNRDEDGNVDIPRYGEKEFDEVQSTKLVN